MRTSHELVVGGHAIQPDTTPVDILDMERRFVTSAECEVRPSAGGRWGGVLTGIEPNKRLTSGRYRLRTRDGAEASIRVRARQRIGSSERYPFDGEGEPPAFVRM